MVRIVSGAQANDPNAALLQGMQFGKGLQEARLQRAALEKQAMGRQIQMENLHLQMQRLNLERQKFLQKQAGQGSLDALKALELEMKMKPSDGLFKSAEIILQNMPPGQRAAAWPVMKEIIDYQQKEEQKEVATNMIQDLTNSGVLDESGFLQKNAELAAGRDPGQAVKELGDLKTKKAEEEGRKEENLLALQGVGAKIEAAQPGPQREKARAKYKEAEMSESEWSKPGWGADMARQIEEILIEDWVERAKAQGIRQGKREEDEEKLQKLIDENKGDDPEADRLRQRLSMGVYGEGNQRGTQLVPKEPSWLFESGPEDPGKSPGMQRHIQVQAAKKEQRYPGSTAHMRARHSQRAPPKPPKGIRMIDLRKAKSNHDVLELMKAGKVPLTEENVNATMNAWGGGKGQLPGG